MGGTLVDEDQAAGTFGEEPGLGELPHEAELQQVAGALTGRRGGSGLGRRRCFGGRRGSRGGLGRRRCWRGDGRGGGLAGECVESGQIDLARSGGSGGRQRFETQIARGGSGGEGASLDELPEGFADGGTDDIADEPDFAEADLALGGVDVDIDAVGVDLEKEEDRGEAAFHDQRVIGVADGAVDEVGLDGPAVDEGALIAAAGAGEPGPGDVAAYGDAGLLVVHRHHGVHGVLAEEERGAGVEILAGLDGEDAASVEGEFEGDFGVGERLGEDHLLDVAFLGGDGAEELAAGRHVVEEVGDRDGGAGGAADGLGALDDAAVDGDLGSFLRVGLARLEIETGDGSDARERLAAKAESEDAVEILGHPDFAGGVGLEAEEGIFGVHAATIVDDADEGMSTALDGNLDAGSACVEAVLDKFLDDGGGALDDLAGGDAVADLLGEDPDDAHSLAGGMRLSGGAEPSSTASPIISRKAGSSWMGSAH